MYCEQDVWTTERCQINKHVNHTLIVPSLLPFVTKSNERVITAGIFLYLRRYSRIMHPIFRIFFRYFLNKRKSSTYVTMIIEDDTNKQGSTKLCLKPNCMRQYLNISNQLAAACFTPYIFILNSKQQFLPFMFQIRKAGGRLQNIATSIGACENAKTYSICVELHPVITHKSRTIRTMPQFTTGTYIVQSSNWYHYISP